MITQLYDLLGPHYPFGQGLASSTISSDPCVRASASGTSGSTSLTVTGKTGTFSNGDLIIIHHSRLSSDSDNWEVNQILSGAETGTFILKNALGRTYTNQTGSASAQKTQVITVPQYLNLTMNSFTGTAWRDTVNYGSYGWGGIMGVAVRGTLTISGTPNFNGKAGFATTQDHGISDINSWYTYTIGGGFRQGWNSTDASHSGVGEGIYGSYEVETASRQANGAGASSVGNGGGNGTAGGVGNGQAGIAVGNASLSRMWFGGGGSGGKAPGQDGPATGGNGGGIFVIWANIVRVVGGLQAIGGNGGNTTNPPYGGAGVNDGGGGAGGSILINCNIGTFGTNKVLATGGKGYQAGAGGAGRIRINYASVISGTTNPTASTAVDRKLRVPSGMLQVIG